VEGMAPEFDTIADGSYPISRPLYFYVKKAHIGSIPGIQEYLAEFTSDAAMGEDGYLLDKGLIPLSEMKIEQLRADIERNKTLDM
jgi:phosphate transport system substrate-binding protein